MSSNPKEIASAMLFRPQAGFGSGGEVGATGSIQNHRLSAGEAPQANARLAFAGLYLFNFLLYARPQEMFPELFGSFPLVKIVAVGTLLAYFAAKLTTGERFTLWTKELAMVLVIAFLGIAFTPIAAAPQDSLTVLLDTFLKIVIIFVLMINLLNSKSRLRSMMKLSVVCGSALALFAIISYVNGNFLIQNRQSTGRVMGIVQGMFGNPNDLALSLNVLLPLAVAFALCARGWQRLFYFVCTAMLTVGVVVTFSRGGFLGLVAAGLVLLWKLGRRNRGLAVLAFVLATGFFLAVMPAGYSNRLTTIFSMEEDLTGSSQARRELLNRATEVASNHLLIGVGMGNFHIYSIREQVAHNSYLEIAAELGLIGLLAYLILILSPLRSLRRLEGETRNHQRGTLVGSLQTPESETYYLSVALQASLAAYIVCSFFGSVQYLWHLYYLVAYSFALKQIHVRQESLSASHRAAEPLVEQAVKRPAAAGVLWQAQQAKAENRLQVLQPARPGAQIRQWREGTDKGSGEQR
jgi:probable O-glycosylation ligase (exosortase A-associated)